MARRPARWAVAAGVTVAVLVAASAVGGTAHVPNAAGSTATTTTSAHSETSRSEAAGRTPYETRLLRARAESLDLEPLVGDRDRSNVLVLLTDDMRDDDLKFMPRTRRLIGDAGVRFVNSFSPYPLCCPARASFLTGQYTHNHGVYSNVTPFAFHALDDRHTFAVWLRRAGYRTSYIGKYLNGYGGQPTRTGSPSGRYVPPGWTDWRAAVKTNAKSSGTDPSLYGNPYHYFDTTLNVNGRLQPHPGRYQTFLYADLAREIVQSGARHPAPFLSIVSFTAPHDGKPAEADDVPAGSSPGTPGPRVVSPARPAYAKGRFAGRVRGIPGGEDPHDQIADKPSFVKRSPAMTPQDEAAVRTRYVQRAESLAVVDDEIANIMAALERTGELDNTYVVFTSDNGYFVGEHRRRIGKKLAYEASIRVPMLMRGPGIPAGEERTDPLLIPDLAPTIRDMAGLPPDLGLDGVSMLDVARRGDHGWTRSVLLEGGPRPVPDAAQATMPLEWEGTRLDVRYSLGVRTAQYLYVEHTADQPELYDLRRDPRQRVNLAASSAGDPRVRRLQRLLSAELDRLRDCSGAGCAAPAPQALRTGRPAAPWSRPTLAGEERP